MFPYPELHTYEVRLPEFQGPLAVLLDLIERARLDITRLALAQITEQFLDYVETMPEPPAEVLSAFLVVAARLLYIKSRALLPRPPSPEEPEEDAGEALVQQLRIYRRFRRAGEWLQARAEAGWHCFPSRFSGPAALPPLLDLRETDRETLRRYARRLLRPQAPPPVTLPRPRVPVRERLRALLHSLRRRTRLSFFRWLRETHAVERSVIVASFLALLELLKRRQVRAEQPEPFGDIWIVPRDDADGPPYASSSPS